MSDKFVGLSDKAKLAYFIICLTAYDKGISINAVSMTRVFGGSEQDVKELVDNNLLSPLEDEKYLINHWYINNGIGETHKKRNSYSYRKWRKDVFVRDGFACTECGSPSNLEAHHILSFAENPELGLDVDNGITLCRDCHRKLHGLVKNDG